MNEKNVYSAVPPESGETPLKQKEPVAVRLDRGGRQGKTVTLIDGLRMHPQGKQGLLRILQKRCGAGGTLKGGVLELQGDQRARVAPLLEGMGYRVKVS